MEMIRRQRAICMARIPLYLYSNEDASFNVPPCLQPLSHQPVPVLSIIAGNRADSFSCSRSPIRL